MGTEFHVHNGAWEGTIVMRDNDKCVLIDGDNIKDAKPIVDDRTLDISIKGIKKISVTLTEEQWKTVLSWHNLLEAEAVNGEEDDEVADIIAVEIY